jgi:hypothetical protein
MTKAKASEVILALTNAAMELARLQQVDRLMVGTDDERAVDALHESIKTAHRKVRAAEAAIYEQLIL